MINELIEYIEVNLGSSVTAQSVVEIINGGVRDAAESASHETGSTNVFDAGSSTHISATKLTDSKVIVAYCDTDNSSYATAIILDVSGGTITEGTSAVIETIVPNSTSISTLTSTKAIVVYISNATNYGTACILDVSTSTITPATPVRFNEALTYNTRVDALTSTKAIVSYRDSGNSSYGTACILDVSTSTITPGTEAVFETVDCSPQGISKLTSTKAIVGYTDNTNNKLKACILDVSTSTITPATPKIFNTTGGSTADLKATSETTALAIYRDAGNSNYGTAQELTISTSTITEGTEKVFESSSVALTNIAIIDTAKVLVSYSDVDNSSYGTCVILNNAGDILSSPVVFQASDTRYISACNSSTNEMIISYQDFGAGDGTSILIDIVPTPPTNAIGIAKNSGSSGKVAISFGQLIGGFTGLTQGAYQYVADDGTLTETPETVTEPVAIAISETVIKWLNPII